MKIQGAKKVHYDSGPNMTPLVDVVMVILIFLMLAGTFTGAEHYLIADIPIAANGASVKPIEGTPIPKKFTITVHEEGSYYIAKAGNFASVRSTDPQKAYDQLKADLISQIDAFKEAGVNPDEVQVTIFPSQNVTLENLVPVFEAAQDAGFKQVGFGITQGQ